MAHACFSQNITLLTVYANLGESGLEYALKKGEITHIATSSDHIETIRHIASRVESLTNVILLDNKIIESDIGLDVTTIQEVEEMGIENFSEACEPEGSDIALIMFTSGTTGTPKGAVISHQNVCAAIGGSLVSGMDALFNPDQDVYLAYLPLAHILAFIVHFVALSIGVRIGFGSSHTLLDSQVKNCSGDIVELKSVLLSFLHNLLDPQHLLEFRLSIIGSKMELNLKWKGVEGFSGFSFTQL
jgi:long-chain acyl-CoA synthetase